jgi:hypothetical protein
MSSGSARGPERGPGRPLGRRARGTNHQRQRTLQRPRQDKSTENVFSRGRNLPEVQFYLIEISSELGLCLSLLGVDTVSRGVCRPETTEAETKTVPHG